MTLREIGEFLLVLPLRRSRRRRRYGRARDPDYFYGPRNQEAASFAVTVRHAL